MLTKKRKKPERNTTLVELPFGLRENVGSSNRPMIISKATSQIAPSGASRQQ
jgi:hypothetical protein